LSKWSYGSCAVHFLLMSLTTVWSCIEFQPVVFKLCSGQGKVTKGNNSVISQDGVVVLVHCTFLNILDHCMKLYWIPTVSLQVMLWTKENNGKVTKGNNSVITLDSYGSCALHFPLLWLTIVLSCFEFQPVVFKLCSGQGKVTKGNNSVIS
jgi:hypothetical protein